MSIFPSEPVTPRVFFEESVPALFATVELDDRERTLDLKVGVVLRGGDGCDEDEEGGEWTLHFSDGELGVSAGRVEDCEITIVQQVKDWRSALWEGRPALIAETVALIVESGPGAMRSDEGAGPVGNPEALKGLSEIHGLIEAIIASDHAADRSTDPTDERSGQASADDWRIGIRIGPGPIPDSPQATIRLGAAEAEAMRRGDLHPVEALMSGQLRLEGDLGLIIQLQAVAMTASMAKPTGR